MTVEAHDRGPGRAERCGAGPADPRRRARHHRHRARERGTFPAPAELRLLQFPVLDVEDVGRGQCDISRQVVLGGLQHVDRVAVDVGADLGGRRRLTDPEHAEALVEHEAWCRIEHGQRLRVARGVRREVLLVAGRVPGDVPAHQRHPFGADHVIGREWTAGGQILQIRPGEEPTNAVRPVPGEDEWSGRGFAQRASQPGQRDGVVQLQRGERATRTRRVSREPPFDSVDQLDVAGVGLPRGLSEREQSVIGQHHAVQAVVAVGRPE